MAAQLLVLAAVVGCALPLLASEIEFEDASVKGAAEEPPEMTPKLWCTACHATLREAKRRMPEPRFITEADVYTAFSDLDDDPFRFSSYAFSPPTVRYAVGRFLDEFEEIIDPRGAWPDGSSLEDAFLRLHSSKTEPESGICEALCKGIEYQDPGIREDQIRKMQSEEKARLRRMKEKQEAMERKRAKETEERFRVHDQTAPPVEDEPRFDL